MSTDVPNLVPASRNVMLRDEQRGHSRLCLWAYLDQLGNLHIDGQDLGPVTGSVSSDGEYEWFQLVEVKYLPRLVELLGGTPGEDVLDLLEAHWTGTKSYDLEQRIRESDIPVRFSAWSG